MKGLELAKKYYKTFGEQMIHDKFYNIEKEIAVGLIGSGSECFGFDDDISIDHDFEPGFCIFVRDDIDEKVKFNLTREYAKLPREFMGYKREVMSPVGGNRHGVINISDFLYEKTGTKDGNLSIYDWLKIPEENLAEITNGEIWRDDSKLITSVRYKLSVYPEDIKLKKLAGELLIMAQSGQYNYKRSIQHKEYEAARLSAVEFVNACIHATCLFNEVYMPYYKWKFRVLKSLSWPNNRYKDFKDKLSSLLCIRDDELVSKASIIEEISLMFVERIKNDNLTMKTCDYLESHAYEVNNHIKDVNLRNMNILSAV